MRIKLKKQFLKNKRRNTNALNHDSISMVGRAVLENGENFLILKIVNQDGQELRRYVRLSQIVSSDYRKTLQDLGCSSRSIDKVLEQADNDAALKQPVSLSLFTEPYQAVGTLVTRFGVYGKN